MGNEYLTYLHDLFADFCPVTTRAMFGGHGVYRDGVIIGIVIDDTLYLKVNIPPNTTATVFVPSTDEDSVHLESKSDWGHAERRARPPPRRTKRRARSGRRRKT